MEVPVSISFGKIKTIKKGLLDRRMNSDFKTLPQQSGTAFQLQRGDLLKVTDPEGKQVSDLFCVAKDNVEDALSSGRSIDYNETVYFSTGHKLYAQSGRVMFTLLKDDCGRHDFLVTPCSLQMFQMLSGKKDYHPSCQENLIKAFRDNFPEYKISESAITTTFNIFMNVPVSASGKIQVLAPLSRPGDSIVLRAEMDLIVALTACSDEGTNAGRCKSIEFKIESCVSDDE